jgi:anti-sigma factor RsiW
LVTCKDFLREISDYLDEGVDPVTRAELQQHIDECPNCWVVFDTTKKTIQVFRGLEPQPLPEPVHQRLMRVLEQKCPSCGATSPRTQH